MSGVRETGPNTGELLRALASTPEPPRQHAAGERIGRFVIEGSLGRGGMGIVYRARDTVLGRPVALKMVRDPTRSSELAGRFHREAMAGACIADRRVAAVHDLFEDQGELVLAMQLVEGRTLRARLGEAPIGAAEAERLARGIAAGLAAAHAAGVVHRDLKPENVMIEPGGEPVLLDFGVALFTRAPSPDLVGPEPHPTGARVLGTLHYASPEQLAGSAVGPESDVFSFGVVLHEILSGGRPFGGTDAPGLVVEIREAPALGPEVPAALARVVARCLAKEPAARYPSARELLAALAAEPHAGDPEAALEPTLPAGSRAVVTPDLGNAPTVSLTPPPSPRRRRWAVRAAVAMGTVLAFAGGILAARTRAQPAGGAAAALTAAPVSAVPAAQAEFAKGVDAYRHRSLAASIRHHTRALELDPALVASRVRLAAAQLNPVLWTGSGSAEAGRRSFADAREGMDRLGPRDRAYFLAHQTLALATPDLQAFLASASDLARAYPDDAEILFLLATAQWAGQRYDEVKGTLGRVTALDPTFGPAYALPCHEVERTGIAEARTMDELSARLLACYEACLHEVPALGTCHSGREAMLTQLGRCQELEAEGRTWDAVDPDHSGGLAVLADALFGQGKPIEAVEDAAQRARAKGAAGVPLQELWLQVLAADFDRAAGEARRLVDEDPSTKNRIIAAVLLVDLLGEAGRTNEARPVIEAMLRRSAAWTTSPIEQTFLAVLALRGTHLDLQAGRVTHAAYRRAREALDARVIQHIAANEWTSFSVSLTPRPLTDAEARDLLHVVGPAAEAQDVTRIGEARLRTGDAKGAIADLALALKPCAVPAEALWTLPARAVLGEALEKTGDIEGARRQYEWVLRYWGNAKPRSVTAEAVKARLAALR